MNNYESPSLARVAIKWALVIAGYTIGAMLLQVYILGQRSITGGLSNLLVLITLIVIIIAGINWRRLNEGYSSYGNMFQFLLLTLVTYRLIVAFLNWLIFNVIDPETGQEIVNSIASQVVSVYEQQGLDEFADAAAGFLNKMYTLTVQTAFFIFMIIVYLIESAILAAFLQKKEPDFE